MRLAILSLFLVISCTPTSELAPSQPVLETPIVTETAITTPSQSVLETSIATETATTTQTTVLEIGTYVCRDEEGANNGYTFDIIDGQRYTDSLGGSGTYTTTQYETDVMVYVTWEDGSNKNWNTSFYIPSLQGDSPVIALKSKWNEKGWICQHQEN
jgi:hypothetical protein